MAVRAVLFDAFGTIIHPEPGWEQLRAECLTIVHGTWTGRAIPLARFLGEYEKAREAQHAAMAAGLREADFAARFRDAVLACGAGQDDARAWGAVAAERYHRFQQGLIHAYDQPHKVLADLKAQGHRLGLVSNYAHAGVIRDALGRLGLLEHFDALVVSADVGYLKPHPAIFQAALDALDVAPAEAVMVGNDLECDVAGARKAGLRTIWTPYPRVAPVPARPPEADAVVERLADIPSVLPRLATAP